jgi:hypothetical protein
LTPVLASLVFLTPLGGLAALAALLPLAALARAARRERQARELLQLRPPAAASRLLRATALAAVPALLAVAATQPGLRSTARVQVRADAQALFVLDVSRSMLAADGPAARTRLERAKDEAIRLRAALPEIPSGVATMTDRVLPSLLPVADRRVFDDTVRRAVSIEQPSPASVDVEATTLESLAAVGTENFFPPSARRRLIVVLTDGESRPFDARAVARALAAGPGTHTVFVHVWSPNETVFGPGGSPEQAYRPDPASGRALAALAAAVHGSSFAEGALGDAAAAARSALGRGPTAESSSAERTKPLAPFIALAALLPLLALLIPASLASRLLARRPAWLAKSTVGALLAIALLPASRADAAPVPGTYAQAGDRAVAALLDVFYAGNGRWRACALDTCPQSNQDWGVDSLTYALYLRWRTTHDRALVPIMKALQLTAPSYPAPCRGSPCDAWSDVPEWDAIAALREYEVTGQDPQALAKAEAAYAFVADGSVYAAGACPEIRYQQPFGSANRLKTLETDANAIKASLLLYRATRNRAYLDAAVGRYASVRRFFLDPSVPLYSVYVFDDGTSCTQLPHRFFASVNGDMIWNGLDLFRQTRDVRYRSQAIATARAVATRLSDPAGVFADLQAENDIVEPLVEAMYDLATDAHVAFARRWILANAAAALSARAANGTFGRFFDGPPPGPNATAWQSNGGLALMIAAAALDPDGRLPSGQAWRGARSVAQPVTSLPATVTFTGSAIAFVGTLGKVCCEAGHARVLVDGRETFDGTGIWQNKSSLGRELPGRVLFAWRWPKPGRHTIAFEPGEPNAKEGGPFLDLEGYLVR